MLRIERPSICSKKSTIIFYGTKHLLQQFCLVEARLESPRCLVTINEMFCLLANECKWVFSGWWQDENYDQTPKAFWNLRANDSSFQNNQPPHLPQIWSSFCFVVPTISCVCELSSWACSRNLMGLSRALLQDPCLVYKEISEELGDGDGLGILMMDKILPSPWYARYAMNCSVLAIPTG